jgi:cytochrome c nitrite reductase small subunit
MTLPGGKTLWLFVGIMAVAFAAAGVFVSFGPPQLFAKSESPEFCAGCHVMEAQYDAWFYQGAHKRIKCIECHLPNDQMANHLAWKGLTGMWDVYIFYSGKVPEVIRVSEYGAKIAQENCERCHAETISRINVDRKCWECHRRVSHKHTGSIETQSS